MTLSEFKAWFEGFTDGMDGPPPEKQWKKIKARVAEITGEPITAPIFIDRYWPRLSRPWWDWQPYWGYSATSGGLSASGTFAGDLHNTGFNSTTAMFALGKADVLALEAA